MKTLFGRSTAVIIILLLSVMAGFWLWPTNRNTKPLALVPYEEETKFGVKTRAGEVVLPAQYDWVDSLQEGVMAVHLDWSKSRILGANGQWKSRVIEGQIYNFNEGLAPIERSSMWGFIDKRGNVVIPPRYEEVMAFSEGLALIKWNSKFGIINKRGQVVTPPEYSKIESFIEGLALVEKEGKWGYINKQGKIVISPKYNGLDPFGEGLFKVYSGGKYGLVNKQDKVVVPIEYEWMGDLSEGLAQVTLHNKEGFIDEQGQVVIPLIYDDAESFSEGVAPVAQEGGKYKFIDKKGQVVLTLKYNYLGYHISDYTGYDLRRSRVEPFREGLALVEQEDKFGFIGRQGQEVIPLIYDDALWFSEGLASVRKKEKWGCIDKEGRIVIPIEQNGIIDPFEDGIARRWENPYDRTGGYSFINRKGETVK